MASRAWEMERDLRRQARPPREGVAHDALRWKQAVDALSAPVRLARVLWESEVPASGAPDRLIVGAIQSVANRGRDVTRAEALIPAAQEAFERNDDLTLSRVVAEIYRELWQAPLVADHPYHRFVHPDTWEDVRASLPGAREDAGGAGTGLPGGGPDRASYLGSDAYLDRVHAAWLGKNIGGALGTPLEGYTGRAIREAWGEVRGYVRPPSTLNDDITYEIAFLSALESHGAALDSQELALRWLDLIPMGWSAELVALDNLRRGLMPPVSGRYLNPYSEWIGAQMRGEVCGLVAPGRPMEAVRWAWIDGIVSHEKNGVYAEMYNAALVSLAFVQPDVRALLEQALAYVPQASEFADVVRRTLGWCRQAANWQEAWARAEAAFEAYHWIHAYPNAAAVIVGLWWGQGDFDETLHVVAMCGLDVDCNAGQAGAILGAAKGTAAIPAAWSAPLEDTLETYVKGFERMRISELARWTARLAAGLGSGR
ncbi:ADP-ribosylglycohydrolase family protein [Carboxydochorda subterranea]|uniref:ADP-ribosylglycohydrolase family protein n=1 Tax=Carboxydichorda subterranea TaxID=3109565 RepID=A0ABZ1BYM6_9FIRM|nr:ADP-ribosylglycohydrolase family protein [Limnochorda sp. L945t]WRP17919.1 ADP-ribosylglycohydrolase family protein [Limnochorda sp. L945t]